MSQKKAKLLSRRGGGNPVSQTICFLKRQTDSSSTAGKVRPNVKKKATADSLPVCQSALLSGGTATWSSGCLLPRAWTLLYHRQPSRALVEAPDCCPCHRRCARVGLSEYQANIQRGLLLPRHHRKQSGLRGRREPMLHSSAVGQKRCGQKETRR